jgi:DNA invertase Pin-like site-specific DNA recombinase
VKSETCPSGTPCVVYAAKSSEDVHGSIPTQLADCRAYADREGWEVAGEFADEAFSAYSGNRGPDLERAKAVAGDMAAQHGRSVLVAQDADRFARGAGDAPGAADHLGEVYFAMKRQGVELWTVRSGRLDLLRAAIEGERSHDESARKSQATAAGHRRRFESGKRLGGPIPDGYRLESVLDEDGRPQVGRDGRAVREPQLDPERAALWRRIFDMVEAGNTCGDVQRTLNAEGIRTNRAGLWNTRKVRRGVIDPWYAGRARAYGQAIEKDHPPLIDPDRWERIVALVSADDPVSSRAGAGGRPATPGDEYLLRGIGTCGRCGSSLYTRRLASGRQYRCGAAREATGLCDAPYISAERVELEVLGHLESFVGDVDRWLAERVEHAGSEREHFAKMIAGQRSELRKLDRRVQDAHAQYERLLGERDDELADAALRKAIAFEAEHDELAGALAEADQSLAEWPTPPGVDDALDLYSRLRDAIQGRLDAADSVKELNATLRSVLAEAALRIDGDTLHGRFRLRVGDDDHTQTLEQLDVIESDEFTTSIFRGPTGSNSLTMSEERATCAPREEPAATC